MFIRTPLGIDKIIYLRIQDEYGCNFDTQLKHNLFLNNERDNISIDGECFEKEEIKTSYNIIDILEVGDYVNGLLIVDKFYDYANKEMVFQTDRSNFRNLKDIKSIVTSQQFESMQYRLGDDK